MTTLLDDVRPIAAGALAALRSIDDAGRPPRVVPDDGGSPLRCCLRRSTGGESIALVSYAPLRRWSQETGTDPGPYDELGPVFIHMTPCNGPASAGLPLPLFDGRRVLRAYGAAGSILGGWLVEPADDPEQMLAEIFADPAVAMVHARFAEFGCFMVEIRRS
jgi:hypothetical protein